MANSLRMRQSAAAIERKFERELELDRRRGEQQRQAAVRRTHTRRRERIEKHQTLRFVGLVSSILLTAVLVTWAMFQVLALLLS